ncbi:MAG: hypothetical protein QW531_03765 [Thermoplasmata archaeon]
MEWNLDFSFDYYRKILSVLSSEFECALLADVPDMKSEEPIVCVRHDIDVDPEKAIKMAEIEEEHGLVSTYYVIGKFTTLQCGGTLRGSQKITGYGKRYRASFLQKRNSITGGDRGGSGKRL